MDYKAEQVLEMNLTSRRFIVPSLMLAIAGELSAAQGTDSRELTAFESRLGKYVEMHQRLEGPLPPLQAASDIGEVRRLMDALRLRIRTERKRQEQGHLFTPAILDLVRRRIASSLSNDDIASAMEDIDEHTPVNMPPLRINDALPEDAPFGLVPPLALRALPPLPSELRYMILSKALVIWDHHADLVVDIAPGVFDAATYRKSRHLPQ